LLYVLDEAGDFASHCNQELVASKNWPMPTRSRKSGSSSSVTRPTQERARREDSRRLDKNFVPKFVKVLPKDYARVLKSLKRVQSQGLSGDDAIMAAFEENIRSVGGVGGG